MRKKMWKRAATMVFAVICAVSMITTAEIVSGVGSVPTQADEQYTMVTKDTHSMTSGEYRVTNDVAIDPDGTGNGIKIEKGAKVVLYIEKGKTLTVRGKDGQLYLSPGRAAILLPEGSTLTIAGEGTLNATGGNGGDGTNGNNAEESYIYLNTAKVGYGGRNSRSVQGNILARGVGGYGAGAGIGTDGGKYGLGGDGGSAHSSAIDLWSNRYGHEGMPGEPGSVAEPAGTVIVTGSVTVNAQGGKAGNGGVGGKRGKYEAWKFNSNGIAVGTSGGAGGGGGGGAADGIGSGGSGGGGGGGGASGNIDGEAALLKACDLDDLWGYGGYGGDSYEGNPGNQGDYGASNGGDSTGASERYAKSGGVGGRSPARREVAFYTYKSSKSDTPVVNCTTGSGRTRSATPLGNLQEFMSKGGSLVSGGTFVYDGRSHGVTVNYGAVVYSAAAYSSSKLLAQASAPALLTQEAGGKAGDWDEEGSITVDGVDVSYKITYYDTSGERVGAIPVNPGQYAAVITFTSENPEYCGDWIEPFTISKIQVEKPAPKALTFECGNWETGEGAEQDAFPGLDETNYEFVPNATLSDSITSIRSARSAKAAGNYQACFRLKDPAIYEWAGESEDAKEVWIPWSIALQEFDANDPEVTYWGTEPGNNTTTIDYTGEPVWVRPWFTPAKDADGRYPEWFTHWGSKDRPTTDRLSSAVFYMKGEEDREGLVGYHTGADGSLEKVTAEQVYVWVCGVEIDGELITVESGDKVWYKTDEEGWKIPLAVGEVGPEEAEGYVVARDYAYADKLGVKDPGTYRAYTAFDDGAGFAATGLAETTVVVRTDISGAKVSGITNKIYTGKKLTQSKMKVVLNGKTLVNGTDYKVAYANNKNAGTAIVKIIGINLYKGTINKTFKIAKATQKVKAVSPKSGTIKKVAPGKSFVIKAAASKEKGTAQFKKVSGNRRLKISSSGKVTVKKGLVKGHTYKLKYKVRIKATQNYKTTKYVIRTIKIKIR